jgi:hypothetical protein
MQIRASLVSILTPLLVAPSTYAQTVVFPNHCSAKESVFLSAKMKYVIKSAKGLSFKDSGKILSLCADKSKDPVGKLSYRFGGLGKVELERVATNKKPFGTTSRHTGPRMSEELYFFGSGDFSYYVVVAGGMASGVSLVVYKGNQKIVDMFSGNDMDTDYTFPGALTAAAVLVQKKPAHEVD